jgi:hypothetical protein
MDMARRGPKPIVYLAAPYSHPNQDVRLWRYQAITAVAAHLISQGEVVFSPITMTHPIDLILAEEGATLGSDYWVDFDTSFMQFCSEIAVLRLDGWHESRGVQREIAFFKANKRSIRYIEPSDLPLGAFARGSIIEPV